MQPTDPRVGEYSAAMIDRIGRNSFALVEALPAATPIEIIFEWAEEHAIACDPAALVVLGERLRGGRLLFTEDGKLAGALVSALLEQASNIKDGSWPERNRLRILGETVRETLRTLGLL